MHTTFLVSSSHAIRICCPCRSVSSKFQRTGEQIIPNSKISSWLINSGRHSASTLGQSDPAAEIPSRTQAANAESSACPSTFAASGWVPRSARHVYSQRRHEHVPAPPHLVKTEEADADSVTVRPKVDGELTTGKKTKVWGMRFDLQPDHWLIA
ncbi:uncharacterized protein LOC126608549 [Malus sylvestris]|uniref:uncharacterized protein LOC126608549 n=1 Tax=Malus sylvestris TaxID=3752 RepID=UPI0021AC88E5|nr:uncharacterized protein LOC126608549 [Malus sylvestris]